MGYFMGWGKVQKLFWGLLIQPTTFVDLYHTVLSLWCVVSGVEGGGGGVGWVFQLIV